MMLVGVNSRIQSSTQAATAAPALPAPRRRPGMLRAGVAICLLAVALVAGIAHPAETSAKKSTSTTCTTLEGMFTAVSKAYEVAAANGMPEKAELYLNTSFWLQGIYLDLDCSFGPPNLGEAT